MLDRNIKRNPVFLFPISCQPVPSSPAADVVPYRPYPRDPCNPWFILKTAVGTTDFADNTDKEEIAVEGVFTRRVAAKEVLDHDKARSHPCHPCHPWFLNCRS